MGEIRAALAIARKEIRGFSRYRIAVASTVFTPLYQFVIPAFLFGAAFAVNGRAAGLAATVGTDDLPGFIFFGGLIGGLIGKPSGASRSRSVWKWTRARWRRPGSPRRTTRQS